MVKLNKMQAQAIISKLSREVNALRKELIEKEKKNYTPSENALKLKELTEKSNRLRIELDAATEEVREFARNLGVIDYYNYYGTGDILAKLIDFEIEAKYPKIDLDAALDDLIIKSVEDDFDIDNFIEHYLKQVRNE